MSENIPSKITLADLGGGEPPELTEDVLRIAMADRNHIQSNGCAVEICGTLSGHFVKPIAFCDTPVTAALIASALKAHLSDVPA